MSVKVSNKKIPASDLIVDFSLNVREPDNYDVGSMMDQVRQAGKVLEPIAVHGETNRVIRGNRRTLAVQTLLKDRTIAADLKAAIEKLDCIVYIGMSQHELTDAVYDHGSQKPISRSEIVNALWRLQGEMYGEQEIITKMYHSLARYTNKPMKAQEASQIVSIKEREKFLHSWLHGTVGNFLMIAGKLGPVVREQLLLTERKAERKLTETENLAYKFDVTRERVKELFAASKEDKETTGWDSNTGGVKFNALIEKYSSGKEDEDSAKPRPNKKQLMDLKDIMLSDGMKLIAARAAGEDVTGLVEADQEIYRMTKIREVLVAHLKTVKPELHDLLTAIAFKKPADVEALLS